MAVAKKPKDSKSLAIVCAKLAAEKNASEILVLNIGEVDGAPAEWFVIASAASDPQLRSMAESMISATKKLDLDAPRSEGWDSMNWIIVDYFDVVVHLMKEDAREYYKLEKLWSDAEFFKLSSGGRMMKYDPLIEKASSKASKSSKSSQTPAPEFEDTFVFDGEPETASPRKAASRAKTVKIPKGLRSSKTAVSKKSSTTKTTSRTKKASKGSVDEE